MNHQAPSLARGFFSRLLAAFQGLSQNEIGCARISMMARSTNAPCKGRIQMRKTNPLHLLKFSLQRTAGPYSWVNNGPDGPEIRLPLFPRKQMRWMAPAHGIWVPKCEGRLAFTSKKGAIRHEDYHDRPRLGQERF